LYQHNHNSNDNSNHENNENKQQRQQYVPESIRRRQLLYSLLAAATTTASAQSASAYQDGSSSTTTVSRMERSTEDVIVDWSTINVMKPPLDDREYRLHVLGNGLRVVLCSDPTSNEAGAAMDVHVGACSDPVDIPGLAHFNERE
jgi:hypothetical protein